MNLTITNHIKRYTHLHGLYLESLSSIHSKDVMFLIAFSTFSSCFCFFCMSFCDLGVSLLKQSMRVFCKDASVFISGPLFAV